MGHIVPVKGGVFPPFSGPASLPGASTGLFRLDSECLLLAQDMLLPGSG